MVERNDIVKEHMKMIDNKFNIKQLEIRNKKRDIEFDLEMNENLMNSIKTKLKLIDHLD